MDLVTLVRWWVVYINFGSWWYYFNKIKLILWYKGGRKCFSFK
ncbi:hypothetical protein N499_0851 [Wolbachia pipientis wVitA]|nr:hypothetical protein N500_1091 [Wolbachia pipientis wUni]ONI57485.1 hypothetical protein N499_0851 [Wolbachia pipientis wVitA]